MNANQILNAIKHELGCDEDTNSIINALEDGAYLASIGVSDDDQEAVEEAYEIVLKESIEL